MKRLTDFERKNQLMACIAEKLKLPDGETTPQPTTPRKCSSIRFCEDDTIIELQSVEDNIEQLSEVLLQMLEQRKGY